MYSFFFSPLMYVGRFLEVFFVGGGGACWAVVSLLQLAVELPLMHALKINP